jgi:multisubunit Na+/H+ antiporter MnhB subunit
MADRPVSRVARDLRGWTLVGLVMTLISGLTMWAGHGVMPDLYESGAFWLEMELLLVAMIFHFTLYRWVTSRDESPPVLRRFTAILALFLWFGVGVAGRAIGFF